MSRKLFSFLISLTLAIIPFKTMASTLEPIDITLHVDDAYPPYSFTGKNGQASGLYIDILRTAFDRMKQYRVMLKPVPWQRGKNLMEQGQGIGLAPAFYHGHDWPYLHPYSLPFYVETIQIYCREELIEDDQIWPKDFQKYRIGNVQGFDGWGGTEFRQLVKAGKILYSEFPSSEVLIKSGMLGRVDCLLMEKTAFQIEYTKLAKELENRVTPYNVLISGAVSGKDPVYIGYSKPALLSGKHPYLPDFMQALDNEIYHMQKSGEIDRIMSQGSL
ncbi:substrate-binding periplasmic protein [Kiloniella sp.]|uniref:substrate-binding periplasmic protein n=1 Tax=Kiloniella sp. TaxID=1938587 RepID=UPI003B016CF2